MTLLEEVSQMKTQGISEEEIIRKLQDQGISPKSINDALNQTNIKNAVSGEEEYDNYEVSQKALPSTPTPQRGIKTQEINDEDLYAPQQQQEEYSPQDYSQYQDDSTYAAGIGTDTVIEISEQVFSEKIQKIQKQVEDFSEFKILTESKIENFSERLKRIELMIDKLQTSILEKVGFYGENLEGVKKEISMMQDSFRKIINPLADKTVGKKLAKNTRTQKTSVKKPIKKVRKIN